MTVTTTSNTQDIDPIHALYHRLEKVGFDKPFVQNYVLPEWWTDALSNNPAACSMAEVYISRMVGIPIKTLRDPAAPLLPLNGVDFRLKKIKTATIVNLQPAIMLSQALAMVLVRTLDSVPIYQPGYNALDIRQEILEKRTSVDLAGLLEWAWKHGIIVVHLKQLPKGTNRLTGVAMCIEDRPVIVLAEKQDSPPWLAFHLAHELGHILKGHVKSGQTLLDERIEWRLESKNPSQSDLFEQNEIEANELALSVLTGESSKRYKPTYGLTAKKLARIAHDQEKESGVNAGTLALIYGYTAERMGVAGNALKELDLQHGARQLIADMLIGYLPKDIPEALDAFLPLLNLE